MLAASETSAHRRNEVPIEIDEEDSGSDDVSDDQEGGDEIEDEDGNNGNEDDDGDGEIGDLMSGEDENADEEEDNQYDDYDDDDMEEEDDNVPLEALELGGPIDVGAFALLDGIFQHPGNQTSLNRVTIALTRLPAVMGRSHDTPDKHFFGLGQSKVVSRKQCTIYYRDPDGGQVVSLDDTAGSDVEGDSEKDATSGMKYQPKTESSYPNDVRLLSSDGQVETKQLPKEGFFVIECLGKNRIVVDGVRVHQGDCIRLKSGSSIRISSYLLYFLLPTDTAPKEAAVTPPQESAPATDANTSVTATESADANANTNTIPDKSSDVSQATKRKEPDSSVSSSAVDASSQPPKSKKSKSTVGYQAELDALTTDELMERMNQAMSEKKWERRHQLIGSTIAFRAVREAATDVEIQKAVHISDGISRSDLMDWITNSSRYSAWVKQILTKMEERSYQAAITKCLLKAGFTRTGSSGRYVRWLLPADIPITFKPSATDPDGKETKSGGGGTPSKDDGKVSGKNEDTQNGDDEDEDEENKSAADDEDNDDDEEDDDDDDGDDNAMDEEEEQNDDADAGSDGDANMDDDDDQENGHSGSSESELERSGHTVPSGAGPDV